MRKLYLALLPAFVCVNLLAQPLAGKVLLGAQLSFNHVSNNDLAETNTNVLIVNFNAGKFLKPNHVLGIHAGALFSASKNDSARFTNSKGYSGGLFYRVYQSIGKKFYLFGDGSGSYHHSTYNSQNPFEPRTQKLYGAALGATGGLAYKLFRRTLFELTLPQFISIGYQVNKIHTDINTSKMKAFYVSSALRTYASLANTTLGFRFVF